MHLGAAVGGPVGATADASQGGGPGLASSRRVDGARGEKQLIGGWTGHLLDWDVVGWMPILL
jgi:hypothetical protein